MRLPFSFEVKDSSYVSIGHPEDLSAQEKERLMSFLKSWIPWKKGPFSLFGESVDGEWRSDYKWNRIAQFLDKKGLSLADKIVADVGCHNGYFMFRMLNHQTEEPREIWGYDPVLKHQELFECFRWLTQKNNMHFVTQGVDELGEIAPQKFDFIFCLGVLYHRQNPMESLKNLKMALKPGGWLILDCQGVPDFDSPYGDSLCLVPKSRYAQARGVWFLPTAGALKNMVVRSGFRDVEVFYNAPLSPEEQRATPWAPVESLIDFLDTEDPSKTKEGYPAPSRIYLAARV